jgi:uncharacterized protein YkwD
LNATVSSDAESTLSTLVMREHDKYCNPLSKDMRLVWMARFKAMDMAYNNYFGHTDSDGRKTSSHLSAMGISYHSWSEIIAYNAYPVDISAKAAFTQFMNSSIHREMIVSCNFTKFGTGAFRDGTKKYYVVEFMRP